MHMNINIPALPLPPSLTLRNVGTSWWRKKNKNEEAYQNRKYISTGLSQHVIKPVAAPLRTRVAPRADWRIKVAAVSLQV